MTANEFIKKTRKVHKFTGAFGDDFKIEEKRPRVICADGYSVSMQVGDGLYSEPREYGADYYSEVELGYPNMEDELINEYAECGWDDDDNRIYNYTKTVYPYVPVEIVDKLFEKHGGIVNEF